MVDHGGGNRPYQGRDIATERHREHFHQHVVSLLAVTPVGVERPQEAVVRIADLGENGVNAVTKLERL